MVAGIGPRKKPIITVKHSWAKITDAMDPSATRRKSGHVRIIRANELIISSGFRPNLSEICPVMGIRQTRRSNENVFSAMA